MHPKSTTPRICEQCGNTFAAYVSNLKRGWGRYCSHACADAARSHTAEQKLALLMARAVSVPPPAHVPDIGPCLLVSAVKHGGYARVYLVRKHLPAHRFVYEQAHGPLASEVVVCHRCDRPNCIALGHLFPGTLAENTADMVTKGRNGSRIHPERWCRGEQVAQAKLTEALVIEIRRRHAAGETQRGLARAYGVGKHAIASVVRRETWRHIP